MSGEIAPAATPERPRRQKYAPSLDGLVRVRRRGSATAEVTGDLPGLVGAA